MLCCKRIGLVQIWISSSVVIESSWKDMGAKCSPREMLRSIRVQIDLALSSIISWVACLHVYRTLTRRMRRLNGAQSPKNVGAESVANHAQENDRSDIQQFDDTKEEILRERSSARPTQTPAWRPTRPVTQVETTVVKTNSGPIFTGQGKPMDIDRYKDDVGCRYCKAPDHKLNNCPNRRACFKCGEKGHIARNCRNVVARQVETKVDPDESKFMDQLVHFRREDPDRFARMIKEIDADNSVQQGFWNDA